MKTEFTVRQEFPDNDGVSVVLCSNMEEMLRTVQQMLAKHAFRITVDRTSAPYEPE